MSHSDPADGGSTSTSKVLLIILGIGGVLLLVCCGGGYFLFRAGAEKLEQAVKEMTTEDPAEINRITASIVDITMPEAYSPKAAVKVPFVDMQMCFFMRGDESSPGGDSSGVMIMQMPGSAAANKAQMKQQFQQQARQQQQNPDVAIESTETHTFTIDGEEYQFEFIKGKNAETGQAMRQVMGVIPSKKGVAFLMVFETEENWDEEAVVRMIESIGGGAEGGTSTAPEMEEAPVDPAPVDAPGEAAPDASEVPTASQN